MQPASCRTSPRSACAALAVAWAACAAAVSAQDAAADADPLKSAACAEALAVLNAAREGGHPAGEIEGLRATAARSCLGPAQSPQRSGRAAQAPLSIPPTTITPPAAPEPPARPALAPPPPPLAIQRPATITHCDAAGCWVEDDGRMRHLPPGLVAPSGLCTPIGGVVHCP